MRNVTVAKGFEQSFLSQPMSKQIGECDRYELAPLFLDLFRTCQPVLEAGCGSGRWCAWFKKNGIRCDGLDWSHALCRRAAMEAPGCHFVPGDIQMAPFRSGSYGGILALGSVEHVPQGPVAALEEFRRLLRPGGRAVVTVPFGGPLRRTRRRLETPLRWARTSRLVRSLRGLPNTGRALRDVRLTTRHSWCPVFFHGDEGWFFYEYEFSAPQFRSFVRQAGLQVVKEFVGFLEEGVLHNFGSMAGRWNDEKCDVEFTTVGDFLRRILPVKWVGAMLCFVLMNPGRDSKEDSAGKRPA